MIQQRGGGGGSQLAARSGGGTDKKRLLLIWWFRRVAYSTLVCAGRRHLPSAPPLYPSSIAAPLCLLSSTKIYTYVRTPRLTEAITQLAERCDVKCSRIDSKTSARTKGLVVTHNLLSTFCARGPRTTFYPDGHKRKRHRSATRAQKASRDVCKHINEHRVQQRLIKRIA
jgi:hypothetical protein